MANEGFPLIGIMAPHMYSLLNGAGTQMAPIQAQVVAMTGCNNQALPINHASIVAAVVVALGRNGAQRLIANFVNSLNRAECTLVINAPNAGAVHADHMGAFIAALTKYGPYAERLVPILSYNAINIITLGHSHLTGSASRLTQTTMRLSPIRGDMEEYDDLETAAFHDMYHNVGGGILSMAARSVRFSTAAGALGFDNLRKRIPITHSDTGPIQGYRALFDTARAMPEADGGIDPQLAPPAVITAAIDASNNAAPGPGQIAAVTRLRTMSSTILPVTLYLAGYILGCLRRIHDSEDMTLRTAKRTYKCTILGAKFIERECGGGAGAGSFIAGLTQGSVDPGGDAEADLLDAVQQRAILAVAATAAVV